jgi:hypothetical protein
MKKTIIILMALVTLSFTSNHAKAGEITLVNKLPVLESIFDEVALDQIAKDKDKAGAEVFMKSHLTWISAGTTVYINRNDFGGYVSIRVKGTTTEYFLPISIFSIDD